MHQKYLFSGVVPPNMFDRLQRASFLGGFNACVSGNMPAMSHYVATGMEPFVAVYMAVEVSFFYFTMNSHLLLLKDWYK